jgi:hypothetical protein
MLQDGPSLENFFGCTASQRFPLACFRVDKNDEPLAIALVVDTSGSMTPKLRL